MIEIQKSPTADTRTCDWSKVSKQQLVDSSLQHIGDVSSALLMFSQMLRGSAFFHDADKLTGIDEFHADFRTGFNVTTWWDKHRKGCRHHIASPDGVPDDVNLIDVLEYVADCVMAGMARTGEVFPLELPDEVLQAALRNTVEKLKANVVVVP